jgi:hypothetical protein
MDNQDEAWFHGVMRDFNIILNSGKYGPLVWENLHPDSRMIISNIVFLDKAGYDVKCQLESD